MTLALVMKQTSATVQVSFQRRGSNKQPSQIKHTVDTLVQGVFSMPSVSLKLSLCGSQQCILTVNTLCVCLVCGPTYLC